MLGALRPLVLDLLDQAEVNKRATILPPSEDEFENVLLVEGAIAAGADHHQRQGTRHPQIQEKLPAQAAHGTGQPAAKWHRFVLVKVDARDGMSMYPRLLLGATLLIDRHQNALTPYRKGEKNMYAVRTESGCTVKYRGTDRQ